MPQGRILRLPRRHRIVRVWLLSYIVVFMVSFIACCSAFFSAYNTIEKGITNQNRKQLEQIILAMDRSYAQAKKMTLNIQLDSRLKAVINVPTKRTGTQNYNCYMLQSLLDNFCFANDVYKEIAVYLTSSDLVIANNTVYTFDLLPYMKEEPLSVNDWNVVFEKTKHAPWYTTLSANGMLYLSHQYETESGNLCYFVIVIQHHHLKQVAEGYLVPGSLLLVTDTDNNIVFDNRDKNTRGEFTPADYPAFVHLSQSSSEVDLTYHYLIPHQIYHQERDRILVTMIKALGLSLLLGFACIYFFIRYNYAPITKLLRYIHPHQELPDVTEYEIIRNSIVHSQQQLLENQLAQHRKFVIYQILSGRLQYDRISTMTLQKLHLAVTGDVHHVIVVSFSNCAPVIQAEGTLSPVERMRILNRLCDDLKTDDMHVLCTLFDVHGVMILSGNEASVAESLNTAIHHWRTGLSSETETECIAIGVSSAIDSTDALPSAYEQAKECVEYVLTFNGDMLCRYEQLQQTDHHEDLIAENSALVKAVMNGNTSEMSQLMQIIRQNAINKNSLFDVKYTLFFLYHVSIQLKESFIKRDNQYPPSLDNIRSIFSVVSLDQALDIAEAVFKEACSASESANPSGGQLSQSVYHYIETNYIDPNLNVNTLAEAMGISASYLSRKFKNETGLSIPDEINHLRIQKAKELLLTTEMKSSDIAEAVGFLDSNALIRVFKKHEGITPGTYRSGREVQ